MEYRKINIFEDEQQLVKFLVNQFIADYEYALSVKGFFCVALSGGKTPFNFYKRLSEKKINWEQVYFFLVDERFVDLNSKDSNYFQIKNYFFNRIEIKPGNVFYFDTSNESIDQVAKSYQDCLTLFFESRKLLKNEIPVFDSIYLGIGEDGHTASLFPECNVDHDNYIVTSFPEKYKFKRVSMNYPLINNAHKIFFIVKGKNKADIISEVFKNEKDYPATRIIPVQGKMLVCIDKEAASLL